MPEIKFLGELSNYLNESQESDSWLQKYYINNVLDFLPPLIGTNNCLNCMCVD